MEDRNEKKERRNITIDPEINGLCNKMSINVSRECNNFLKLLVNMEDIEEEEILRKIAGTEQEIRDKHKEITILQNKLEEMRSRRSNDKEAQENKLLWNKLISEYRENYEINPTLLKTAINQLNMTEEEIFHKIERELSY